MSDLQSQRPAIALRLHDLLLHALGERIDTVRLLGVPDYARAVSSLCRGSGHAELAALGEEFQRVTRVENAQALARELATPSARSGLPHQDDRAMRLAAMLG